LNRFCIYGNPTIDIIKLEGRVEYVAYGGGSYYSSLPLLERGFEVRVYGVYTPLLVNHPISRFMDKKQFSTKSTIFVLEYMGNTRRLRVYEASPPIYSWNMHAGLCYTIVNPVLGEVDLNLLRAVRLRSAALALDVQGFIREAVNGAVVTAPRAEVFEALSQADVVHMDLEECQSIGGSRDIERSAKVLARFLRGAAVVTIPPDQVVILENSTLKRVKFDEAPLVRDSTGSGDYFLALFFVYYSTLLDAEEAAFKAHEGTTKWLIERETRSSLATSELQARIRPP